MTVQSIEAEYQGHSETLPSRIVIPAPHALRNVLLVNLIMLCSIINA